MMGRRSLRRQLLLSSTMLVGTVTGYGGRAYAACILTTPPSTFTCSAANNTQQTITTNNANVSTVAGFSVVTGDARALSITAAGDLTYTDANASTLTSSPPVTTTARRAASRSIRTAPSPAALMAFKPATPAPER